MDSGSIAKEAALHLEAKFYSFRKTREGTIVAFVVHPADVPNELATADIGQRFAVALVPLTDKT